MSGSLVGGVLKNVYRLAFEASPIILSGGIASRFFGYMPIIVLTEALSLGFDILQGNFPDNIDKFFAHFRPLPGNSLAKYSIASYPFANQYVAANALIAEPLTMSFLMDTPVNRAFGYELRLATMMAVQAAVQAHANQGGTYILATPANISTGWILTDLVDASENDPKQAQTRWLWNFTKPLLVASQLQGAQSTSMQAISNGAPTNGSLTAPATSGAVPSIVTGTNPVGINPVSPPVAPQ